MDFQQQILQDSLLLARYQFICKLGQGCFGKIYKVKNKQLKMHTAVKIEITDTPTKKSMLEKEAQILKKLRGKPYTPLFYFFGQWNHGTFMQIQLLAKDLNSYSQKTFTQDEITNLTVKLLQSLSVLHSNQILHQDIKPQNIMINNKGQYIFIDFGISRKLKDSKNQAQARRVKGFIGTPRYASIQAHKSLQQSKKDDLQSLMYNVAFLYFKKLPWLSLKVAGGKKIEQIKKIKLKTADEVFQRMGKSFHHAFHYIKKMQYMQQPNYKYLISIFRRNQSLIVNPVNNNSLLSFKQNLVQNKQTKRKQAKKLSLNLNNPNMQFLAIPNFGNMSKQQFIDQVKSQLNQNKDSCANSQQKSSMGGTKAISVKVHYNQNENQQNSMDSQNFEKDFKIDQQSNKQSSIPNIAKFLNPLTLKNPFFP